jgi:hypothetical protein
VCEVCDVVEVAEAVRMHIEAIRDLLAVSAGVVPTPSGVFASIAGPL